MMQRFAKVLSYLRGDFIVLRVDKQEKKVTVDAGNLSQEELRKVASTFFLKAHNLSNFKSKTI